MLREFVGFAHHQRRVIELLKIGCASAHNRELNLAKRRLGTHRRVKRKRDKMAEVVAAMRRNGYPSNGGRWAPQRLTGLQLLFAGTRWWLTDTLRGCAQAKRLSLADQTASPYARCVAVRDSPHVWCLQLASCPRWQTSSNVVVEGVGQPSRLRHHGRLPSRSASRLRRIDEACQVSRYIKGHLCNSVVEEIRSEIMSGGLVARQWC